LELINYFRGIELTSLCRLQQDRGQHSNDPLCEFSRKKEVMVVNLDYAERIRDREKTSDNCPQIDFCLSGCCGSALI
jgi:hypothetical protein